MKKMSAKAKQGQDGKNGSVSKDQQGSIMGGSCNTIKTSTATTKYIKEDKKNNIDAVEKPRPTLLLTSTVNDFTEGTSQEDSSSGFFNRLVTFVDTELPPLKDRTDLPDRQAVIDLPEDVAEAVRRMAGSYMGPSVAARLTKISILITEEAQERLFDIKFAKVEKNEVRWTGSWNLGACCGKYSAYLWPACRLRSACRSRVYERCCAGFCPIGPH